MEVIVIGAGSFVPELKRHCSSYLFKIEKEKLIFDFGRGTLDNLMKAKINLDKINKIFISHLHIDHFAELSSFLFYVLYRPGAKNYLDINIYGPRGIKKSMKYIFKAYYLDKHKYLNKIKIKELFDKSKVRGKGWEIRSFKVKHSEEMNCLAYRIKADNKVVCYSGDSGYCKGLKEACKNSDLAIIEATLPEGWKMKEHMTGKEVGKLASESKIKKLVLTHIASFYLKNVKKDVKENYKGKIILAKDLLKIKV